MEILAVLSGLAVVVLVFVPNGGLSPARKLGFATLGIAFAAYGLFVRGQTSGTWTFPVALLALPLLVGAEVWREIREHRRREVEWQPQPAPGAAPAAAPWSAGPGPTTALPAASAAAPGVMAAFCTSCGHRLRADVHFCTRCGAPRFVDAQGAGLAGLAARVTSATGPTTALPRADASGSSAPSSAPLSASPWPLRIALGVAGVVVLVVATLVIGNLVDRGPSAGDQADVAAALMAAATESACVNPAIEGQYFAEEIAAVIDEDTWVDSPAYSAVVEAPFVQLAQTCGYDYGLAALNSIGIVGVTYRAVDGAMMAAAQPVVAEPAPEPEDADDEGGKEPAPTDNGSSSGDVELWGGGAVGEFGAFAPEADVLAYLTDRLGPYESMDDVTCYTNAVMGRQYRWGDFVVFVDDEDLTFEHSAGGTVTAEAPYVGGWMLLPGDGSRTGLRTADGGLGKDDSVEQLLSAYPDAYPAGPGDDGTTLWEYFAGDLTSYVFETTGEGPGDWVLSIRSGFACEL